MGERGRDRLRGIGALGHGGGGAPGPADRAWTAPDVHSAEASAALRLPVGRRRQEDDRSESVMSLAVIDPTFALSNRLEAAFWTIIAIGFCIAAIRQEGMI